MEQAHLEEVVEEEWADHLLLALAAVASVRNAVTGCLTSSDNHATT